MSQSGQFDLLIVIYVAQGEFTFTPGTDTGTHWLADHSDLGKLQDMTLTVSWEVGCYLLRHARVQSLVVDIKTREKIWTQKSRSASSR